MGYLTPFQRDVVKECMSRRRGCICVPMGAGKTLIGLSIINRIGDTLPALVVCSKTLIGSWVSEIQKFFGDKMRYVVYHGDHMSSEEFEYFVPAVGTDVVITTPDALVKSYKHNLVEFKFTRSALEDRGGIFPTLVKRYIVPSKPFLTHESVRSSPSAFIYAIKWKCLIVDEVQQYTNIDSARCEAISAIYSRHRWVTSGTPITEPKIERLIGYHMLIGDAAFPNCKPDAERYLRTTYPGLSETMVMRTSDQLDFVLPKCTEHIISHTLSREEEIVYRTLRDVLKSLVQIIAANKNNPTIVASVNAQLLSMVDFMRQFLVCPLTPYASIMSRITERNAMSECFTAEIDKHALSEWLDDPDSSRSSRIKAFVDTVNHHANERVILFSCYRTNLNVIKYYLSQDTGRPTFTIKSSNSIQARMAVIDSFEKTSNGILLLTYEIGAEGLNLQSTHVLMLADMWWNDSRVSQAIARVLRRGQTEEVNVYMYTSDTGIERGLYDKHIDKRTMINSLMDGKMGGKIRKLRMRDIVELILEGENTDRLRTARRLAR